MLSLYAVLPDVAQREIRSITMLEEVDGCPAGSYHFTEFYCEDLNCDCNNVIIKVLQTRPFDARDPGKEVATFNYHMCESKTSYWNSMADGLDNPFLDPLHRQAPYADAVMEMWLTYCQSDPDYLDRLERHHMAFRRELRKSHHNIVNQTESIQQREPKSFSQNVPRPLSRKEMKQRDRQRQRFIQMQRNFR